MKKQPRIIAIVNQKGGVGKTTSTVNIGAGLAQKGKNVLLVDLDPQANLTYSLGIEAHNSERTIYEVLKGEILSNQAVLSKQKYDIIPASLNLSGADIELSNAAGRDFLLKEALTNLLTIKATTLQKYDYILLDCPPSLGLLTLNGLVAAKEVFIPLQTEFLAMQGMSKLLEVIETVKKRVNKQLTINGIIATLYDSRKNLNNEVIERIKQHFPDKLFKTFIRSNVSLAEAPSYGKDIFAYKPDSYGAEDYLSLTKEIIKQEVN